MRSDKKSPLKSDKKSPPKVQKKGTIGYNKKSALLEDAITQMNAGKYGRAASALKDLLALDPLNAEARRLFATLHLRLGSLLSARTAFESLAREAMERQDYWLAESLLREYLTAGPRCVPFLEMLGHVYEEKGDVMAAVAEYGKAVEVLLEDPDADNPNRASELFVRIRAVAPGSPVAFRFAAMFDTVTGQVLQAAPQAAAADSASEPPQAAVESDVSADSTNALVMPWEQMEPAPADAPVEQQLPASAVGLSPEVMEPRTPVASVEPGTEAARQDAPPDSSAFPAAPTTETVQCADQTEVPVVDLRPLSTGETELPPSPVAELPQPTIEVLAQTSSEPIAAAPASPAPMPWDQVEDVAAVIPPAPDAQEPMTAEVASAFSPEAEPQVSPTADTTSPTIEVPAQTGSEPIATAPTSPASMPWDLVEDVAAVISPPIDMSAPIAAELAPAFLAETDVPPSPVAEPASPTLEILTTASHHPISEAPTSPAPMPWDQVEETTGVIPPVAEPKLEVEGIDSGKALEPDATTHGAESVSRVEPSTSPVVPETTSSGISWEDILAAVTAMQASSAPLETVASTGHMPSVDLVVPEESATPIAAPPDPVNPESLFSDVPVSASLVGQVSDAPYLSAPMPWEQIEVDDVPIPRQEPEPEFGPVSSDSVGGAQDATLVMPEASETVPVAGAPAEGTVADNTVHVVPTPTSEFRIFSPEDSVETGKHPIHSPVEVYEPVDEPAQEVLAAPEETTGSTKDHSAEYSLRLAESEPAAPPALEEPSPAQAELVTEFAIAAPNDVPPLSSQSADLQNLQAPVEESTAAFALKSAPQVDELMKEVPATEMGASPIHEAAIETSAPSVVPPLVVDLPAQPAEPVVASAPDALMQDASPAPISMMSSMVDQEPASSSAAEVGEGASFPLNESVVPVSEALPSPMQSVPEPSLPQPVIAVNEAPTEEPVVAPVESAQVPESTPTAEVLEVSAELSVSVDSQTNAPADSATSTPASGEGLRILWDDAPSAPASSVSTGNMLTRWLKKPAEVAPAEASETKHSTRVPDEPLSVAPLAAERQEVSTVVMSSPVERSGSSHPAPTEEPAAHPKPSQPAASLAWRRLGSVMGSLVGAGVSTTRSLVVLVLALVGLTLVLIAGAMGGIAVTWMVLEEQPSSAYRSMTSVPQRTLEGSGKNGYLLLLGFDAAATQDPVQAGMERRVAGADRAFSHTCLTGEGSGAGTQQGASAEVAGKWLKTADPAAQMRMEATGVKSWVAQADVSMSRYRQWLTKPFEDWGYGEPSSPNCGLILYAHRLYVAEGFAQDVEAGVARLETDLTAWRTVLGQAKTLTIKMLASDALNDDIMVLGGLLLRPELDERLVSRLAKLARPLDQGEQSVRWPMQSQFMLATKALDETISQDPGDARPLYGSVAALLPLPKQRRFNAYAQYYEVAGKAAGEGRYADLPKQSQFVHAPPYGLADLFVNPIESLVGVDPLPTWETYAGRVLETDARLRLASLQAWLRRTPPEQDLLTRIAKAGQGLYDPFTGYPMLVNMKKAVLYSVGRDFKDNEAQERFDVVVQIPSSAWIGGKRPTDLNKTR